MRTRNHKLWISIALWFLLVLQVSGQGGVPRLADTMYVIANALNSRGSISWREELPQVFGASYTITSNLAEVNADPLACSLGWTSVYTSSDDKLVETYLLRLATVSSVGVQPYSEYRRADAVEKVTVSPESYVVQIKTSDPRTRHRELYRKNKLKTENNVPDAREAQILFADRRTANEVADNLRQAAIFCRTSKPGS